MENPKNKILAFIGAGNMAEALIQGILEAGLLLAKNILATDIRAERLDELKNRYGVIPCPDNIKAVEKADILLLCVKPQGIQEALQGIAPAIDASKLIISVAAGVPISALARFMGDADGAKGLRIIRTMPNTPALVQQGAAALARGRNATEEDLQAALSLLNAVGKTVVVEESLLDAVTGLSGSGPAYVCLMLEALAEGGVRAGLPKDISFALALQTLLGTARLVEKTGRDPAELRAMVTSPGGTTMQGLRALEEGKFRDTVIGAIAAATQRACELGKESGGK